MQAIKTETTTRKAKKSRVNSRREGRGGKEREKQVDKNR